MFFKLFLRVLCLFAVVIGLFLLAGSLLPRDYDVQASVVIDAEPARVFPWVNTLRNWETWSPVSEERIASLKANYSGPRAGEGAIQTWIEARGDGKMWITRSVPDQRIEYRWRFGNFPDLTGEIVLQPVTENEQTKCRVLWLSAGHLPSGPFYGYSGLFFEGALEKEYQKSLERLKSSVESAQALGATESSPTGSARSQPPASAHQADESSDR